MTFIKTISNYWTVFGGLQAQIMAMQWVQARIQDLVIENESKDTNSMVDMVLGNMGSSKWSRIDCMSLMFIFMQLLLSVNYFF
jgi:hypothetical protein